MQSFLQYRRLRPQIPVESSSLNLITSVPLSPDHNARRHNDNVDEDQAGYMIVDWDGEMDPLQPRNWSLGYKIWLSALVSINVFALDWCSAADSQATQKIAAEFHISHILESVASAAFVFGIAAGALFAGPITETVGRNPVYIGGRIIHLGFILGTALAANLATQIACRFLAGLGASTILAIHGASIADLFGQEGRSLAWPFVALLSFLGTSFPPIVGAWIAQSTTMSWRWTDWIAVIMSAFTFVLTFFFLPETFAPILVQWKAMKLRKLTGNEKYIAPMEMQHTFSKRLSTNLWRALTMCSREYIVILLGLWIVVVYIIVFGFLAGMDFLFQETYGFSRGLVGTSFVAVAVGVVLNTAFMLLFAFNHKKRSAELKLQEPGSRGLAPEYRMLPAFPVALCLPISMFWLGWTNYSSISPWSGLSAVALFGFSWAGIYVSIYHYIFDTYGIYAGSALAAITSVRYMFAGGIQIASKSMWVRLETHWACTLLGGIATFLVPVPFVLWLWGHRVRRVSRFAGESMLADDERKASNVEKQKTEPNLVLN